MTEECEAYDDHGRPQIMWVETYVGECAYTPAHEASAIIGLSSIGFWLFSQFPQLYKNWSRKSADGLAFTFLFIWLCGDTTNLIGCILTGCIPTQTYLAVYFCMVDVTLFSQFLYYKFLKPYMQGASGGLVELDGVPAMRAYGELPEENDDAASEPRRTSVGDASKESRKNGGGDSERGSNSSSAALYALAIVLVPAAFVAVSAIGGRSGGEVLTALSGGVGDVGGSGSGRVLLEVDRASARYKVGTGIGWLSAFLYLASRTPQIYKNYTEKSVEGLAFRMFFMAVMGNLTYAVAIFLKSTDPADLWAAFPWLVGSAGTLCFDFTIFMQFSLYGKEEGEEGSQRSRSRSVSLELSDLREGGE